MKRFMPDGVRRACKPISTNRYTVHERRFTVGAAGRNASRDPTGFRRARPGPVLEGRTRVRAAVGSAGATKPAGCSPVSEGGLVMAHLARVCAATFVVTVTSA